MLSLGVDLTERPARAVLVDAAGAVVNRASGEAAEAVAAAVRGHSIESAGVASADAGGQLEGTGIATIVRCSSGAAALAAETWVGVARGLRHVVCLHVGEDVSAGLMLDGRAWSGAHGRAGAAAWLALNPVERQDYRRLGSLAAEISARGIARRLSWRVQAGDDSRVVAAAGGSVDAITGQHVFDGARAGDGVALSVVRDTAKYIGMAVATLAAALDPEMIVLGGSVASADLMLDAVRQECARRLPPNAMADLRVEFSSLGADAIAIGAARLASAASA